MPAPRLSIPTSFLSLDEALYAPGSASHSFLGQKVSERSRWLLANLRRHYAEAWPENQTGDPLLSGLPLPSIMNGQGAGGVRIALLHWTPTPGVRDGEWWLRINMDLGDSAYIVPFVHPAIPLRSSQDGDFQVVGTGSDASYGPIPVTFPNSQPAWIGLLAFPWFEAGTPVEGDVQFARSNQLISTSNEFVGLTRPYHSSVRLFKDVAGVRRYYGPWCRIQGVDETDVPGDTVHVAGDHWALTGGERRTVVAADDMQFELRTMGNCDLKSVSFFENALTGRL